MAADFPFAREGMTPSITYERNGKPYVELNPQNVKRIFDNPSQVASLLTVPTTGARRLIPTADLGLMYTGLVDHVVSAQTTPDIHFEFVTTHHTRYAIRTRGIDTTKLDL